MTDAAFAVPGPAWEPTWKDRGGIAWRALWPLLVWGLGLLAFMVWTDARFPERFWPNVPEATPEYIEALKNDRVPNPSSWTDFAIFFSLAWFLKFKSNVMGRRLDLREVDWLAISLIAANVFFSFLYDLFLASSVYPYWIATHHDEIVLLQNGLRVGLILSVAASIVLLILTPDPDDVRWPWVHSYLAPALVAAAAFAYWASLGHPTFPHWQVALISAGLSASFGVGFAVCFTLLRMLLQARATSPPDDDGYEAGARAGYVAGQVIGAETIEKNRSDAHDAGRVAERATVNGDIKDAHDAGVIEGRAERPEVPR